MEDLALRYVHRQVGDQDPRALVPAVNLEVIAAACGVGAITHTTQNGVTDGFVDLTRFAPVIYLNGSRSTQRQRFTLAHEIGHVVFDKLRQEGQITAHPHEEELRCDNFAARLLLPDTWLRRLPDLDLTLAMIEALASTAAVSRSMVVTRLNNLGTPLTFASWKRSATGSLRGSVSGRPAAGLRMPMTMEAVSAEELPTKLGARGIARVHFLSAGLRYRAQMEYKVTRGGMYGLLSDLHQLHSTPRPNPAVRRHSVDASRASNKPSTVALSHLLGLNGLSYSLADLVPEAAGLAERTFSRAVRESTLHGLRQITSQSTIACHGVDIEYYAPVTLNLCEHEKVDDLLAKHRRSLVLKCQRQVRIHGDIKMTTPDAFSVRLHRTTGDPAVGVSATVRPLLQDAGGSFWVPLGLSLVTPVPEPNKLLASLRHRQRRVGGFRDALRVLCNWSSRTDTPLPAIVLASCAARIPGDVDGVAALASMFQATREWATSDVFCRLDGVLVDRGYRTQLARTWTAAGDAADRAVLLGRVGQQRAAMGSWQELLLGMSS